MKLTGIRLQVALNARQQLARVVLRLVRTLNYIH